MNDKRNKILNLLAEDKISVDEAERLLDAVNGGPAPSVGGATGEASNVPRGKAKFLRLHVDSDGNEKVDIKLPMQLLRSGLKFSKLPLQKPYVR